MAAIVRVGSGAACAASGAMSPTVACVPTVAPLHRQPRRSFCAAASAAASALALLPSPVARATPARTSTSESSSPRSLAAKGS